uniref:Zinc finger GRF-type domain-containing protein n=1 Tax=Oryza punctata TaxID=4537 RepID=A0A0E0JZP6_ORYPU
MSSSRSDDSSSSFHQSNVYPVSYRVGPPVYQPAVMCHCPAKAARLISWRIENLGHQYYKCENTWVGVRFWLWCDGPTTNFI